MRTTLDLPVELINEAMSILNTKTKSETIKKALESVIKQAKRIELIKYRGKVDLDIDLNILRDRD